MRAESFPDQLSCEVLVIGSGPGGSVTAALCAEAGRSVIMIEEGEDLPLDSAAHFSRAEILQKYRSGGIGVAFGRTKLAFVEGRCVGGGSEVNRGLYHRTPASLLDRWRQDFSVADLDSETLAPHFDACEAMVPVQYLPGPAPAISRRLQDGALAKGWAAIEAPRLFRYDIDQKQSMSATMVPRFRQFGGRVIPHMRATRIRHIAGRWHVDVSHAPFGRPVRTRSIIADKLFVSAGAVQTPALLRRSGIRRNIGNALRFHPMLKVVAKFRDVVNRPGDPDPVHQIKQFEPSLGMGCSISTPTLLGMALADHPDGQASVDRDWQRMGLYYVQSTGTRAKVRVLPGFSDPIVLLRAEASELQELLLGLRRLIEALFAAGAETVFPLVSGWPALHSPDDLERVPENLLPADGDLTSVHVFASCPMGEDRDRCATDSFGRVHGADGLYINDASILCGPTSVNPQGTVMAIAHRNATHAIAANFR